VKDCVTQAPERPSGFRRNRRRCLLGALAAAAFLVSGGEARAIDVEGLDLPYRIRLKAGGPDLVFNGGGVRWHWFFRVYIGVLYLRKNVSTAQAVLADDGPKRLALYVLRDISVDDLVQDFNKGLHDNNTAAQLAPLAARLKTLDRLFQKVGDIRQGNRIFIDYLPSSGTRLTVNGVVEGSIPGADFNRAIMRIWFGGDPADTLLMQAMLGKPAQ
jgi:hypothetical protein